MRLARLVGPAVVGITVLGIATILISVGASTAAPHRAVERSASMMEHATSGHGIAPALEQHFAFFQNTKPALGSEEPAILRRRVPAGSIQARLNSMFGVDKSQARLVKLSRGSEMWIVPGTKGLCLTLVQGNGADGGCTGLQGVLEWGKAGVSSVIPATGHGTYTLHGLLPNGNHTVRVRMDSGAMRTVPVHDNIVYATFSTVVRWFRFKNAYGTEKNYHP